MAEKGTNTLFRANMMKRTYYSAVILFQVLLAYSVEPDVQKIEPGSSTVQSESKPGAPVTLDVQPVKAGGFPFGEFSEVAFTVKNVSDRYIVILSIQPLRNPGVEVISLAGAVYGSVWKDSQADVYHRNPLSQHPTEKPFYDGLLVPGDSISIHYTYRPVARNDQFRVSYVNLDRDPSDDKPCPLPPIYIPKADPARPMGIYEPFDRTAWDLLNRDQKPIRGISSSCSYRAVLIPGLKSVQTSQTPVSQTEQWYRPVLSFTKEVPISYTKPAFVLEDALDAAKRILQRDGDRDYEVVYCRSLGGYLVAEATCSWILRNPKQNETGARLAAVPPALAAEIDQHGEIRVRIGDKQEGLGPEDRQAGWKFWDRYPVIYGDGMYTRGEFITIEKTQLLEFLTTLSQKKLRLKRHPYFFGSAYYELASN
jgi:hypothetical protein